VFECRFLSSSALLINCIGRLSAVDANGAISMWQRLRTTSAYVGISNNASGEFKDLQEAESHYIDSCDEVNLQKQPC
jgi:hypothetical protein